MSPYHKYVFDTNERRFIGHFEEMYQAEDSERFDSWFERDLRALRKAISYTILSGYNYSSILDIGCGKGTFTHLLKKHNNRVVGIDLSETAIRKAKESYPDIEFIAMDVRDLSSLDEQFELVVVMTTFAYVDEWPVVVETLASMTRWLYVAEYIPMEAIGFVKSPDHLISEVQKHFVIRTKILLDDVHCMLFAEIE